MPGDRRGLRRGGAGWLVATKPLCVYGYVLVLDGRKLEFNPGDKFEILDGF